MSESAWYGDGLRFECTGCGQCCTGDPGYVWVTNGEIAALAQSMAMAVTDFEAAFLRTVGKRKSLVELPNGDCIFLDTQTRRCRLYQARPGQCRTWPFWESNVRSARAWEEICRVCPGSGRGTLVPREEVASRAAELRV
jgi:Fe-S-cluster containining protein